MKKPEEATIDLAIQVAKFYGGLRTGGVPEMQAALIAQEYTRTALTFQMGRDAGLFPKGGAPWEGE